MKSIQKYSESTQELLKISIFTKILRWKRQIKRPVEDLPDSIDFLSCSYFIYNVIMFHLLIQLAHCLNLGMWY